MRKTAFAFGFGFWPLFLGVLLPYIPLPGGLRLLNIFWSVIDGLGLLTIDVSVGLSMQSRLLILGVLVWPIVVSGAMFLFGLRLFGMSFRVRSVVLCALLASSLLTVNLSAAQHTPILKLPTFYRLFFAVW
jgi:hypothetical protein